MMQVYPTRKFNTSGGWAGQCLAFRGGCGIKKLQANEERSTILMFGYIIYNQTHEILDPFECKNLSCARRACISDAGHRSFPRLDHPADRDWRRLAGLLVVGARTGAIPAV